MPDSGYEDLHQALEKHMLSTWAEDGVPVLMTNVGSEEEERTRPQPPFLRFNMTLATDNAASLGTRHRRARGTIGVRVLVDLRAGAREAWRLAEAAAKVFRYQELVTAAGDKITFEVITPAVNGKTGDALFQITVPIQFKAEQVF